MRSVAECLKVPLQNIKSPEGSLVVVENNLHLPFAVRRIYYLYDVPFGSERGGHAHKELQQYLVALSGSFTVIVDDGTNRKEIFMNNPSEALHIRSGIWREINNFSSGSICLVLASKEFAESDYIRDYQNYLKFITE